MARETRSAQTKSKVKFFSQSESEMCRLEGKRLTLLEGFDVPRREGDSDLVVLRGGCSSFEILLSFSGDVTHF